MKENKPLQKIQNFLKYSRNAQGDEIFINKETLEGCLECIQFMSQGFAPS